MAKRLFYLVLALLVAVVWSGCAPQLVTSGSAPDFTLDSLSGGAVTLSDMKGQVVVLDFWATWCDPCVEGLDHLQQMHERYADRGVTVLAINIAESRGEVADFMEGRGYTFTALLDTDGRASDDYGVQAIPYTVVIDREGEVYTVAFGPDDLEDALDRLAEE